MLRRDSDWYLQNVFQNIDRPQDNEDNYKNVGKASGLMTCRLGMRFLHHLQDKNINQRSLSSVLTMSYFDV
jgi:hypothetical protein